MEPSDFSLSPSSRRRKIKGLLQPTLLDVRHDSHKIIKKQPPAPEPRLPVIIYTLSPEVIHVDRSEFMSLVQRLTGAPSSSSDTTSLSSTSSFGDPCGGGGDGVVSTGAARLTTFERATTSAHPSTVSKQLAEGIDQPGIDAAMRTAAAAGGGVLSHIPARSYSRRRRTL